MCWPTFKGATLILVKSKLGKHGQSTGYGPIVMIMTINHKFFHSVCYLCITVVLHDNREIY
jgi:hypothetical protein